MTHESEKIRVEAYVSMHSFTGSLLNCSAFAYNKSLVHKYAIAAQA